MAEELSKSTPSVHDKTVLLIGIGVMLAAVAAILGMASVRNRSVGMIGLAVFGLLGMVAAVTRPTGSAVDALPSLVGAVAGGAALIFLHARLPQEQADDAQPTPAIGVERRRFLLGGLAAVGTAFAAGAEDGCSSRGGSPRLSTRCPQNPEGDGCCGAGPGRRRPRYSRAQPVHHAERRLLPGRHRARRARGRRRRLAPADPRHGRPRARADFAAAARAAD